MSLNKLNQRVSAARQETEARSETFYPDPIGIRFTALPQNLTQVAS
jgi:hypothetical protein